MTFTQINSVLFPYHRNVAEDVRTGDDDDVARCCQVVTRCCQMLSVAMHLPAVRVGVHSPILSLRERASGGPGRDPGPCWTVS